MNEREGTEPVSYTHLDVYKRQAMERVLDALAEEPIEAQRARHTAAHGEKGITHG